MGELLPPLTYKFNTTLTELLMLTRDDHWDFLYLTKAHSKRHRGNPCQLDPLIVLISVYL